MGGYDKPILHGLCTFGIVTRIIYDNYCLSSKTKEEISSLKKVTSRFTTPIYPGETLIFSLWRDGNRAYFEGKIKERNRLAVLGSAELRDEAKL